MIFSRTSQKIRTQVLCQLGIKKGVDPSFRTLFWEKTFVFGWRQGSAPLRPCRQPKKNFFSRTTFKSLGQLLFFFQAGKDPVFLFFEMGYSK